MKVLALIPAFNEEETIAGVISEIRKEYPSADILVVNDGSRDQTAEIAGKLGAAVVNLPYNLGIGAAMQTGYRYAAQHDYDIAVQVDGDGQHPANQIERLIQSVSDDTTDMSIGSRFIGSSGYKGSRSRRIGMLLFAELLSFLLRQKVTDTTSGFRATNRRVIRFFSQHYPEDYPEVEALVLLHKYGFRFVEVPVVMRERAGGKSSITPFRSFYYMTKVILAVMVNMLRKVER